MLRLAVASALFAIGCYAPELHDCTTQCAQTADCANGQICGSDGWCAHPASAGHCAAIVTGDAPPPPRDGRDPDGPPADADQCPALCTKGTCDNGTCVIDCSVASSCAVDIACPAGVPCRVVCGDKACSHHITCPPSSPCDVQCTGALSCGDQINCGTAECSVTCSGYQSCHRHTNCSNACSCDVSCTGTMSCGEQSMCPLGTTCEAGHGCTSVPAACNTCP